MRGAELLDAAYQHLVFRSFRAAQHARRELRPARFNELGAFYRRAEREGRLFEAPARAIAPVEIGRRALPGGAVVDLSWDTHWRPVHPEAEAFLARHPRNTRGYLRWWRHDKPSPVAIAVHGWGGGAYALEERFFRAKQLFAAGLDLVIYTMPHHALRRDFRRGVRPAFPNSELIRTHEGFSQAIYELRQVAAWLRAQGAPAVTAMGMSMGAYTAALWSTVSADVDHLSLFIPVASLGDLQWELGQNKAMRSIVRAAGLAQDTYQSGFSAVTPVLRAPLLPPEQVLVVAGARDRLIPREHAERLAAYFSDGQVTEFPGAHLIQAGSWVGFREVLSRLEGLGLLEGGGAGSR